jgi:hypothetical protein
MSTEQMNHLREANLKAYKEAKKKSIELARELSERISDDNFICLDEEGTYKDNMCKVELQRAKNKEQGENCEF